MKNFFITAVVLIVTVLLIPPVRTFADNTALKDIPMLDAYFKNGGSSKKAYCYSDYKDGFYTYTYYNSKTQKLLYKSENKFSYDASISKDGKIVFYRIDGSVYRYSYADGKTEKIYTDKNGNKNFYVKASANGEYCGIIYSEKFILWHGGKAVSARCDDYKSICEVTNDGKIIFGYYEGKIFSFSFDTKKTEKIADVSDDRYFYVCDVFYDSGSYVMYGYNNELQDDEDDDPEYDYYKVIYAGKLNEQPKLVYSGSIDPKKIISCSGNGLMICDGEYFIRIDLDSGVSKKIVKLDTERLGKNAVHNFRYSGDLDSVVYIDHSESKLVRLSKWSKKKNAYTKRQEIDLSGTEPNYLGCCGSDTTIVEVLTEYDSKSNSYKSAAAFFESGKLIPADRKIIRIDRFDHVICGGQDSDVLEILNPDGSKAKVFGKRYQYYFDDESGYFIFGTKEATEFDLDGRNIGGIYHDYYIGKSGKAVHLWDGRNTYLDD